MNKRELLVFIGDGEYGSDIPDDDATNDLLSELRNECLIGHEPARTDDFFYVTEAGKRWLLTTDSSGDRNNG